MSKAARSRLLRLRSNRRRLLCLVVLPGWRRGVTGLIREAAFVISRPAPHFRRFTVYRRIVTVPGCPNEGPWAA